MSQESARRSFDSISEELLTADGRGLDARLQEIEAFVTGTSHLRKPAISLLRLELRACRP